jgi:hypothetical protein
MELDICTSLELERLRLGTRNENDIRRGEVLIR